MTKGNRTKGRSTKHTHKTIDLVIRPPLKTWVVFPTSIKILKKVTKKNGLSNISPLHMYIFMNLLAFFFYIFLFYFLLSH